MTKKKQSLPGLAIYTDKRGRVEFRADIEHETLWASQAQIAQLFGAERSVITKHIRNILNDKELSADSVCANFAHTAADGKKYTVQHYNLDVILAVGYRTNSKAAISFRKWATATLREHITKGFTVNRVRIGQNYDAFMRTVADVQALLPEHVTLDPKQIIELIKEFASTWVSLDAYDKDELKPIGTTKRAVALSGAELTAAIMQLRDELGRTGAVTELFAQERVAGSVVGIVGNVMQSFGGPGVVPECRGEGGTPPVLYGQEPSVQRWQQTLGRLRVRVVPPSCAREKTAQHHACGTHGIDSLDRREQAGEERANDRARDTVAALGH